MATAERTGIGTVVAQIRAEFAESPGLRLTPWQVGRLWKLDETQSLAALQALVDLRFLRETKDGAFVRRT
jgi:hypothetical protein